MEVVTWPETEVYPGQVAKATNTYGMAVLLTRTSSHSAGRGPQHGDRAEEDCASQAAPVVSFYKLCKAETSIGVSVISRKRKLNRDEC